ncbi:CCA tRNA nucleotidyltransferase [Companilactobacillus pabuli]|jgi:tRNA nucleotidyltransferase (CCA-adding enzyme)|uniref:CCA-adding enzyme n=1 Tax=Companilactobacillus pabuli TaxID=2714036 RepID=A0A7L7KVX5_9LACO|nr:CCA tRNA nucleotidyltransferase [Companilactobacillus pabuli]AKP03973.1 tRNA CCA-pyrophosphorylase [Companilactobacillus farciminis]AKS52278.1 tRNA CCA-pyrophosphorylase [Companilactobacillus farciminis]MDG5113225.1 CCA tRNA nucleotidyltransferase [Companilactobacillus pabuli]QMT83963.1 CCA tRNA nucleotidyltransferase [Companilactobacillus pabuli]GAQ00321.1 tRNA CCA-pyrophosphorylase [Companilactobacillus farciminis]
MQIKQLPADFQAALPVLKKIEQAGFEAYFVGGSVRDHILGLSIHDVDIATSAYPEEIKEIFKRTVDTGIQHGTVTVLMGDDSYEITTFRTESGYQDYRRPDKVTFVRSLADDLKRRDFTINALAVDKDGQVIDKFDGLKDLDKKIIRAVGHAEERFHEDALRMMRAVRFQAQLNFKIEEKTAQAIADNAPLLAKIAIERIREEFVKMMLSQNWQTGLADFIKLGLSEYCPGFKDQKLELAELLEIKDTEFVDEEAAFSAIGYVLSLNHQEFNAFLRDWKVSNKTREASLNTLNLLHLFESQDFDLWNIYKLGVDNLDRTIELSKMFQIEFDYTNLKQKVDQIAIKSSHDLQLTGKNVCEILDVKPGPIIGKSMSQMERAVVEGNVSNNFDDLRHYLLSNQ